MYLRLGQVPLANPVLWSMVVLAAGLLAFGVPYPTYFGGAQFIHFLLGPAVVALAWPLWMRRAELRRRWARLLWAALFGGAVACASAVLLGWAVGLPRDIILSLAPSRSPRPWPWAFRNPGRHPRAVGRVRRADRAGGRADRQIPVRSSWPGARPAGLGRPGFALGTVSHGIGAARAIQVNADAGAYAGLALGLQVILASLLIPVAFRLAAGLGGS